MKNIFDKNEKGYAILFTVIIVSAISVVAAGISNSIYKQIVLSSLAKDSQVAFYQADTASDCALLFDMEITSTLEFLDNNSMTWLCGGFNMDVTKGQYGSYKIMPNSADEDKNIPCYRVEVTKNLENTTILANGYNICNKNNIRTVERQIKIEYQ